MVGAKAQLVLQCHKVTSQKAQRSRDAGARRLENHVLEARLRKWKGGHIASTIFLDAFRRSQCSFALENPFPVESSIRLDWLSELSIAWSKKNYSSVLYNIICLVCHKNYSTR